MFSCWEPDNPYMIKRNQITAQVAIVRDIPKLFEKGTRGYELIVSVAEKKVSVDMAIDSIRKMFLDHAENIEKQIA